MSLWHSGEAVGAGSSGFLLVVLFMSVSHRMLVLQNNSSSGVGVYQAFNHVCSVNE